MYLCPEQKSLKTLPAAKWCLQECQPHERRSSVCGAKRHLGSLRLEASVSPLFLLMEKSSSWSWTPWSPNGTVTGLGVRTHRFCPPLCGVLRKRSGVWFSSLRREGWPKPGGPLSSAVTYFSLHSFSMYFKLIANIFCASTLMASLGHLQVALQTPFHRYLDKGIYKPTLIQHFIPQCKGQVYFLESLCNFTRDEISRDTDY